MEESFFKQRNEGGKFTANGSAVHRARKSAGLTQLEVEQRMRLLGYYLPQSYISMIENNRYRWGFSERMAAALAAALGVGLTDIMGCRLLTQTDLAVINDLSSRLAALGGTGASRSA